MYRGGPPFLPTSHVASGRSMTVELGGRDRFKFFKRPVVPTLEGGTQTASPLTMQTKPNINRSLALRNQMLQTAAPPSPNKQPRLLEKLSNTAQAKAQSLAPLQTTNNVGAEVAPTNELTETKVTKGGQCRDISCQTMFRENECQTDPYTPDYYVEDGQPPEVLAIMELKYGEGLPAGLAEVEMIDRVQRRKQVESSLPQGGDAAAMQKRLQQLEMLERTEWEERESHIKNLQSARLQEMDDALRRREERREERSNERVMAVKKKKLEEVETKLQVLQEKRLTATRKLTSRHTNPCCEKSTRDVIQQHATYGARADKVGTNSLVEKVSTSNYDIRPTLLGFAEGVSELERTKGPKMEKVPAKSYVPPKDNAINALPTNFQKRGAKQVVEHLDYAQSVIEKSHETKEKTASIQDLYRATPRLQRPDTPTLMLAGDDEEERDEAMLLLQRLLRGRAVQNDFFEGKERCRGLIKELQYAQDAKKNEVFWMPDKEKEEFKGRQEAMARSVVDGMQGDVMFGTLDYLFKELSRQKEAAKIDQLRDHAEATRREREATEAKRRQQEERLREKEEAQYQRLRQAVDYTAETFLVQLMDTTVRATAQEQAVNEHRQRLESIAAEPTTQIEREVAVCNLLDMFVLPEVALRVGTDQAQQQEKAFAAVAMNAARLLADRAVPAK